MVTPPRKDPLCVMRGRSVQASSLHFFRCQCGCLSGRESSNLCTVVDLVTEIPFDIALNVHFKISAQIERTLQPVIQSALVQAY